MVLTIFVLLLNPLTTEAARKIKVKPAETTVIEFQITAKELYKAVLPILRKLDYKIDSKKKKKYVRAIKNDVKIYSIIVSKDASKGRYLILKLFATLQKNKGRIFTNDLMLSYFHSNGSEDRTQCAAIAMAKTAEIGELKRFSIGSNAAYITVNSGKVYFCLAFLVEPDVKTIEIHRMGIDKSLTYRLGTDRLYSVTIYTNKNAEILSEAEKVIKAGGYNVVQSSKTLTKKKAGTTIHYREQTESQAREISQRLMTKLKVIPTLKKMELVSIYIY